MKSIKEKAKAYDNIIKKANKMHHENCEACQMCIEELIPELAESEDVVIKEKIIATIHLYYGEPLEDEAKEMIAWLEKQGENTHNKELSELLHKVICRFINDPNIPYTEREKVSMEIIPYVERLEKQGEQKSAEWKQDNIKELTEFEAAMLHIGESFFGKNHGLNSNDTSVVKEQAMLLLEFVANKPAWSEEDEENNKNILYILNQLKGTAIYKEDKTAENCIDWLKSLKDRYIWKPSDEQIKVCKEVYADILSAKGFDLGTVLSELNMLEEELKKLKG